MTGMRVLVMGAHYPHENYNETVRATAEVVRNASVEADVERIILLADTNQDHTQNNCGSGMQQCSGAQMLLDLGLSGATDWSSTEPMPTCCADTNFTFSYDYIVANFGNMTTVKVPDKV